MNDFRNLVGKFVEIDYLDTGVTVLGKVKLSRYNRDELTHHFEFLSPFEWINGASVITREVGEGSCAEDSTIVKVWG